MKIFRYILTISILSSCVAKDHGKIGQKETQTIPDIQTTKIERAYYSKNPRALTVDQLQNKVFDYGSNEHLTDTCGFYFECDCCSGELIFKEDKFFMLDYCVGDITLTHGDYLISKSGIQMKFSGECSTRAYNWDYEVDTTAIPYLYEDTIVPPQQFQFESFLCNGRLILEHENESLIETRKKPQELWSQIDLIRSKEQ